MCACGELLFVNGAPIERWKTQAMGDRLFLFFRETSSLFFFETTLRVVPLFALSCAVPAFENGFSVTAGHFAKNCDSIDLGRRAFVASTTPGRWPRVCFFCVSMLCGVTGVCACEKEQYFFYSAERGLTVNHDKCS